MEAEPMIKYHQVETVVTAGPTMPGLAYMDLVPEIKLRQTPMVSVPVEELAEIPGLNPQDLAKVDW
jgi:hypothetical protein